MRQWILLMMMMMIETISRVDIIEQQPHNNKNWLKALITPKPKNAAEKKHAHQFSFSLFFTPTICCFQFLFVFIRTQIFNLMYASKNTTCLNIVLIFKTWLKHIPTHAALKMLLGWIPSWSKKNNSLVKTGKQKVCKILA